MGLMNLRNALMAARRLPYDAELEYLQSVGAQWIDTGVIPTSNDTYTIRLQNTVLYDQSAWGLAGVAYCFSNGNGANSGTYWGHPAIGTGGVGGVNQLNNTNWHDILCGPSGIFVDGVKINTQATGATQTPQNSIALFARRVNSAGGGVAKDANCRIAAFRVERNGVLIRDFIPVRVGAVGYLYDRVSGKLFGNAGSGDFVLGQDVVPMTWQDGLQYNNTGTPIESATSSVGLDYIPITAGHSFTWRLGYGSSASADLIIYNANKERIDYLVARDRTITISGAAAYMRISVLTSYKEQATVYDETAQKYVFANGRIPTATTSSTRYPRNGREHT